MVNSHVPKAAEIPTLDLVDFINQQADAIKHHNRDRKSAVSKSLAALYELLDKSEGKEIESEAAAEDAV